MNLGHAHEELAPPREVIAKQNSFIAYEQFANERANIDVALLFICKVLTYGTMPRREEMSYRPDESQNLLQIRDVTQMPALDYRLRLQYSHAPMPNSSESPANETHSVDTNSLELSPDQISASDLKQCLKIFEAMAKNSQIIFKLSHDERVKLLKAVGRVVRPDPLELRKRAQEIRLAKSEHRRAMNHSVRASTTIRTSRTSSVFVPAPRLIENTPQQPRRELASPDYCYICKTPFTTLHHFYDSMCPTCAAFNYEKRFQTHSLEGRVALITGARLKIGYQAALMMLRAGARVIVTTRFPKDAAIRYAKEEDFKQWGHRLQIFGLDLRHSPSVEVFTRFIDQTYDRLDILINNAAQTVRRPPGFYSHMLKSEALPVSELSTEVQLLLSGYEECRTALLGTNLDRAGVQREGDDGTLWISEWHKGKLSGALGVVAAAELSQIPYACDDSANLDPKLFPEGKLDADLQQIDLRKMNSWRMTLSDVPTAELLEVQLVNSIAPYILCAKLKPLMLRHKTGEKHVVNVSAMEGKFNRHTKTDKHPHTNMAKAALNMMTLTSARDYVKDGIFMNAVDTGWVTDEDPAELSARKQKDHDFHPPLDIVDGAARVMDPIFSGLKSGTHVWGNFLKDYVPTEW